MKEIREYLKPGMICRFTLKDGNKPNVVLGEILHVGSSFIVEKSLTNNRVYFLNVSSIQKISILNDGKEKKEKE